MHETKPSLTRSFRLTTRKKSSFASHSTEKNETSRSGSSSFSIQYFSLSKKLKNQPKISTKYGSMSETITIFDSNPQVKVNTETTTTNRSYDSQRAYSFVVFDNKKDNQSESFLDHRKSVHFNRQTIKYHLKNTNKKYTKIYNPMINKNLEEKNIEQLKQSQKTIIKINKNHEKQANFFFRNLKFLIDIHKQLTDKTNKIKPKKIIKSIKIYMIRKQQKSQTGIQTIFTSIQQQDQFKQLIAYERVLFIGIIELIKMQKLHCVCTQFASILNNIIGFYKFIVRIISESVCFKLFNNNLEGFQEFTKNIQEQEIQQKPSLVAILLFLYCKINSVYRFIPSLLTKVKILLKSARKSSINRFFYDLLTNFAIYLNETENKKQIEPSINKYMSSFKVCPSPYILQPRLVNKLTLVLDLDETLIHCKMDANMTNAPYCIQLRPYCTQFMINMSKIYEIVIFTSAIRKYALQATSKIKDQISHILSRQHTIQTKGETIKDISKIGRSLDTTIIIDNLPNNFSLHPQNGIAIKSWYGDNKDNQLTKIQKILTILASRNPTDVRSELKNIIIQNQYKF